MKNFLEWLTLMETVSVYVKDYNSGEKLNNLYDLSWWLTKRLQKIPAFNQATNPEVLTIDGIDVHAPTGRLNFYTAGIPKDAISKILAGIKYYLDELKVKYGPFQTDKSKLFKTEVIRIPIFHLPTQQKAGELPPEFNITNDSADYLFKGILGYSTLEELESINVRDLLQRIQNLPEYSIKPIPPSDQKGEKGARVINFGLDEERIKRYLETLEKLAMWAINHGYDYLTIA
jgi:hypothetical protein